MNDMNMMMMMMRMMLQQQPQMFAQLMTTNEQFQTTTTPSAVTSPPLQNNSLYPPNSTSNIPLESTTSLTNTPNFLQQPPPSTIQSPSLPIPPPSSNTPMVPPVLSHQPSLSTVPLNPLPPVSEVNTPPPQLNAGTYNPQRAVQIMSDMVQTPPTPSSSTTMVGTSWKNMPGSSSEKTLVPEFENISDDEEEKQKGESDEDDDSEAEEDDEESLGKKFPVIKENHDVCVQDGVIIEGCDDPQEFVTFLNKDLAEKYNSLPEDRESKFLCLIEVFNFFCEFLKKLIGVNKKFVEDFATVDENGRIILSCIKCPTHCPPAKHQSFKFAGRPPATGSKKNKQGEIESGKEGGKEKIEKIKKGRVEKKQRAKKVTFVTA